VFFFAAKKEFSLKLFLQVNGGVFGKECYGSWRPVLK
jgi:hypothetical protein